jgi:hypothetical protein
MLSAKFFCHINLEICSSLKSVKYIYKYIYKGVDLATYRLERIEKAKKKGIDEKDIPEDEVDEHVQCRFISFC